ncbi:hypothetical protein DXG03_003560 [Asterophora parasitica]|uniref:Uncharacterized protein n=1 Tax=Asterophora parasitica TaxID=117018 RepID=A0A9P7FYQ6_9AGAR|nr:hypothetical protein DXG03_003560 [Asterophora parasitica]
MFNVYSTTAHCGALDWAPIFEPPAAPRERAQQHRDTRVNRDARRRKDVDGELEVINNKEIRAGKTVGSLRPDYKPESA